MYQLIKIKGKITDQYDYDELLNKDKQMPLKFQVTMACIFETLFGLIGLVIIFFGKAFAYAFYQIFIYVAFLIIRADNEKLNVENEGVKIKIKLNGYDYIISSIMIALTFFCVIFLICSVRKKYYLKYF